VRVLFVGFALPQREFDEVVATDAGMPIQTQRFGWSVIEALGAAGVEVDVVSAAPVTDYPSNTRVVFRGSRFEAAGTSGTTIAFLNITGLKHLSRFVTATAAVRRLARRRRYDAILVHGVHSPFIWVAVRAARRSNIPAAVVLTDPPSLPTPFDARASRQLKRLDRHVILTGLARVAGVVALTQDLAQDFAAGRPWLQFEGIARPLGDTTEPREPAHPGAVVYAGGLAADYGVRRLVEAVGLSNGSWVLHVYGAGPLEDEVRSAAAADDRIVLHGLVDSGTLASAYAGASLLVNPRPVDRSFVRYSFPSKLIEYLGTGRAVMTTRLPTIPADYADHLAFCGDTAAEMASEIDDFFDSGRHRTTTGSGREFILTTRGVTAQGERLREFLRGLADPPRRP
jgi:hypothetical protein